VVCLLPPFISDSYIERVGVKQSKQQLHQNFPRFWGLGSLSNKSLHLGEIIKYMGIGAALLLCHRTLTLLGLLGTSDVTQK
jgi:hypothetical protein